MATPWEIVQAEAEKGSKWGPEIYETAQKWKDVEFNLAEKSRDTRRNLMTLGLQQEHASELQTSKQEHEKGLQEDRDKSALDRLKLQLKSTLDINRENIDAQQAIIRLKDELDASESKLDRSHEAFMQDKITAQAYELQKRDHAHVITKIDKSHNQLIAINKQIHDLTETGKKADFLRAKELVDLRHKVAVKEIDANAAHTNMRFLKELNKVKIPGVALAERGADLSEEQFKLVRQQQLIEYSKGAWANSDFIPTHVKTKIALGGADKGGYDSSKMEDITEMAKYSQQAVRIDQEYKDANRLYKLAASVNAIPLNPATLKPFTMGDLWTYDPNTDTLYDWFTTDAQVLKNIRNNSAELKATDSALMVRAEAAAKMEAEYTASPGGEAYLGNLRIEYFQEAAKTRQAARHSYDAGLQAVAVPFLRTHVLGTDDVPGAILSDVMTAANFDEGDSKYGEFKRAIMAATSSNDINQVIQHKLSGKAAAQLKASQAFNELMTLAYEKYPPTTAVLQAENYARQLETLAQSPTRQLVPLRNFRRMQFGEGDDMFEVPQQDGTPDMPLFNRGAAPGVAPVVPGAQPAPAPGVAPVVPGTSGLLDEFSAPTRPQEGTQTTPPPGATLSPSNLGDQSGALNAAMSGGVDSDRWLQGIPGYNQMSQTEQTEAILRDLGLTTHQPSAPIYDAYGPTPSHYQLNVPQNVNQIMGRPGIGTAVPAAPTRGDMNATPGIHAPNPYPGLPWSPPVPIPGLPSPLPNQGVPVPAPTPPQGYFMPPVQQPLGLPVQPPGPGYFNPYGLTAGYQAPAMVPQVPPAGYFNPPAYMPRMVPSQAVFTG
jgi:hypothetical protein